MIPPLLSVLGTALKYDVYLLEMVRSVLHFAVLFTHFTFPFSILAVCIVQCTRNIFSVLTDGLHCCIIFILHAWFALKEQKVGGNNSAASSGKSYHFYTASISLIILINFYESHCIFVLYNSFRELSPFCYRFLTDIIVLLA